MKDIRELVKALEEISEYCSCEDDCFCSSKMAEIARNAIKKLKEN